MPLPDTLATVNAMVDPTNEVSMLDAILQQYGTLDCAQALLIAVEGCRLEMSKRFPLDAPPRRRPED